MRGREGPMDLDTPRGYSPCWLDESPPKNEITENKTAAKTAQPAKPAPQPTETINVNRTPVFSTFTAVNHGSSGKGQVRVRKSPFYTASPLGSNSKVYKNSFFRRLRSSFSDKDSEEDRAEEYGSKSTGWKKKNASRDFFKSGQHTQYGGNHLFLPFVLMGYLQVLFNGIVIAGILYFLAQVALTIRRDVDLKVDEQLSNIMSEIAHCSKQYIENRCSPELRVPAMEKACMAWEACMKKDPSTIGRAKLSAETFAEVINSLVDPISYKTMMFILLGIFGTMFISNYAFNAARSRGSGSAQKAGLHHDLAASGIMTPVSPFARKAFTSRSLQNSPMAEHSLVHF